MPRLEVVPLQVPSSATMSAFITPLRWHFPPTPHHTDLASYDLARAMKTVFKFDITEYAGMEVHSIDGMDALRYMQGFAERYIGTSRDIGTKLNIAFARPTGRGGIELGGFALRQRLPRNDFLT